MDTWRSQIETADKGGWSDKEQGTDTCKSHSKGENTQSGWEAAGSKDGKTRTLKIVSKGEQEEVRAHAKRARVPNAPGGGAEKQTNSQLYEDRAEDHCCPQER